MLFHKNIWRGIDSLAEKNDLSTSGLAVKAGLDPTSFNESKRIHKNGNERWPSTESISKVLDATRTSFDDFAILCAGGGLHSVSTRITWKNYLNMIKQLLASNKSDVKEAERMLAELADRLQKDLPGGP